MIDMEAREIVDIEYTECERCGLLTHEDEMHHAYAFNGLESWGEALYSECVQCSEKSGYY